MASAEAGLALLASRTVTPIAQLNPELPETASRVVRGEITITWPYNSVNDTLAFLLAEPDVRLRRAKGQVRVQLRGPSAKAVAECGIGAGDEVLLSLDGVKWVKDESPGRIPGARLEWQLQFNEKIAVEIKLGDSGERKYIEVDHPQTEAPVEPAAQVQVHDPSLEPRAVSPAPTPAIQKVLDYGLNEYPSPAFIKRARISYGSLFDGGFDIFEEDGGVKGKGRKRSRFGRDSGAWRYTSQSPSPEPETPDQDAMEDEPAANETSSPHSPKPQMMDEGCQTAELEVAPATPVAQSAPAPAEEVKPSTPAQEEEQQPCQDQPEAQAVPRSSEGEHREEERSMPEPAGNMASTATPPPTTLKQPSHGFSLFGTASPTQMGPGPGLSLADQVRFGFSHIPQTTEASTMPHYSAISQPDYGGHDPYPVCYLDLPASHKYDDMVTYVDAAEQELEADSCPQHGISPEPPITESFERDQWEVATQSQDYNIVEGGHFGVDALEEGTRITTDIPSLRSDDIPPEKVPPIFDSYGGGKDDIVTREEDEEQLPDSEAENRRPGEDLVENNKTVDLTEDKVGAKGEEDAEYDGDHEEFEEEEEDNCDYDLRNYEVPSDDDEGLSVEEEEIEREVADRYGQEDIYDEDGEDEYSEDEEGEQNGHRSDEYENYEQDEDDYDEDEIESDAENLPPQPAQTRYAPAAPSEPVVISLLSDSEDDDGPPPTPSKPAEVTKVTSQPQSSPGPKAEEESAEDYEESEHSMDAESEEEETAEAEPSLNDRQDLEEGVTEDTRTSSQKDMQAHNFAGVTGDNEQGPQELGQTEGDEENKGSPSPGDQLVGEDKPGSAQNVEPTTDGQAEAEAENEEDEESEGGFESQPELEVEADEEQSEGGFESQAEDEGLEDAQVDEQPEESDNEGPEPDDAVDLLELDDQDGQDEDNPMHPEGKGEGEDEEIGADQEDDEEDDENGNEEGEIDQEAESDVDEAGDADEDEAEHEEQVEDTKVEALKQQQEQQEPQEPQEQHNQVQQPEQEHQQEQEQDEALQAAVSAQENTVNGLGADAEAEESRFKAEDKALDQSLDQSNDNKTSQVAEGKTTDVHPDEGDVSEEPAGKTESAEPSLVDQGDEARQEDSDMADATEPDAEVTAVDTDPEEQQTEGIEVEVSTTTNVNVTSMEIAGANHTNNLDHHNAAVLPSSPPLTESFQSQVFGHPFTKQGSFGNHMLTPMESQLTNGLLSQPSFGEDEMETDDVAAEALSVAMSPIAEVEVETVSVTVVENVVEMTEGPLDEDDVEMAEGESHQETGESQKVAVSVVPMVDNDTQSPEMVTDDMDTQEPKEEALPIPSTPPHSYATGIPQMDGSVSPTRRRKKQQLRPRTPPKTRSQRLASSPEESLATKPAERRQRPTEKPIPMQSEDLSIALARQAVAERRLRRMPSPTRTSPVITRARSSSQISLRSAANEDISIALARAAMASPSRQKPEANAAALKTELTKGLEELPECVSLKSLGNHRDKHPNIVAVVTSQPTPPTRCKGGPREYVMSFLVTDPSIGPSQVVEVQLYRPHRESLPVVKPGDGILLEKFQVKALTKKGFGLRTHEESAWAVFDMDDEGTPPQIKGPPVEDWESYSGYIAKLKAWYRWLDDAAKAKLDRANKKFEGLNQPQPGG